MTRVGMSVPERGEASYSQALATLRLSDQVHVLGFTRDARYLTHCLGSTPEMPPPQLLTQKAEIVARWQVEGRKLVVRQLDGTVSKTEIPMPIFIGRAKYRDTKPRNLKIDNLVIGTSSNAVHGSLKGILEWIGPHTTICLLDEGLGVMEHLNETHFPDPETRPTYVLGHMDQVIGRHSLDPNEKFSLALKQPGRLSLTGVPRAASNPGDGPSVNTWAQVAGKARSQHLIRLLSSAPGLNAGALPMDKFLRRKIPPMVLACCADAISAALGMRFDMVARSSAAQALWNQLVFELVDIITSLPELQSSPEVLKYFSGKNFRTELHFGLSRMDGSSPWIRLIRDDLKLPMRYLNGYFHKRAVEVGVPNTTLGMIMAMVRARQQVRSEELKADLPLYRSPYTMDSDLVDSEGQPGPLVRLAYVNK